MREVRCVLVHFCADAAPHKVCPGDPGRDQRHGKVIARETDCAVRKDVTAKCCCGDISRRRKFLEKQNEGNKKMRQFGEVDIPKEAFIGALKVDS